MSAQLLDPEEVEATTVVLAAAFLHALASRTDLKNLDERLAVSAFDLAQCFIAEAKWRFP